MVFLWILIISLIFLITLTLLFMGKQVGELSLTKYWVEVEFVNLALYFDKITAIAAHHHKKRTNCSKVGASIILLQISGKEKAPAGVPLGDTLLVRSEIHQSSQALQK